MFKKCIFMAALAALSPGAMANLLTNGGFETQSPAFSGTYTTYVAGSSALPGWTISGNSIDLINTYWQPAEGAYSIDLSGIYDGVIAQTFATSVGQLYSVSFSMAGNPDGPPDPIKTIQVGLSQGPLYTFDTTGQSLGNMGWATKSFQFLANASSSTLFFAGMQESPYGAALDNVSVSAVPEPESYAMLLGGLGLIGGLARRRASTSKTDSEVKNEQD